MKCIYILIIALVGGMTGAYGQRAGMQRVVLVGGTCSSAVLDGIRKYVELDSGTTLLFLGDNVTDEAGKGRWRSMDAAAALVDGSDAQAIFIPGNKEWDNGRLKGYERVKKVEEHVKALNKENVAFYPKHGCAGPYVVKLGKDARLVIMDTQWWLQEGEKPGIESDCPCKTEQQITDKLEDIVGDNRDKFLLFAGHHPFHSTGIRSGYFGPRQHIFPLTDIHGLRNMYLPLPGIGSLYPVARNIAVSRQDATHEQYAHTTKTIESILKEHPFLVRAAGHERLMELYEDDGQYYITSGAGSSVGRAVDTRHTPYVSRNAGFSVLEISEDKKVVVVFYEVVDGRATEAYRKQIVDFNNRPPMPVAEQAVPIAREGDSVTVAVRTAYGTASLKKRLFLGNNYRKEWSTPITVPLFHIAEDPRQFKIEGQGGGKQTTTIRLKDKDGKVWSLRSIVKDPEKVLPSALRETVAQDVMKDILSSSHPFAPIVANGLSDAAGVVRPRVTYYYVPDDTALGYYRPAFANTVVALEEHQPSRYGEDTKGTWKVYNDHIEEWKEKVDSRSFLRARLLDILLADFDRHYEQWKWGETPKDADSEQTYYAIPKDRDQALFYNDGLLLKVGANQGMSYLKGLQNDIANVKSLGFVSRDIDPFFLNNLTAADWEQEIKAMQASLTDEVIHASVAALPQPAYGAHGAKIEDKLRHRRDVLLKRGMEYYRFLSKNITVVGSNKDEEFDVDNTDSGVVVRVYSKAMEGKPGRLKYSRVIKERETDEVRFYGLGGDDVFKIAPDVPHGIRFRIVGGNGRDTFDISGKAKNFIYDAADGENVIVHRSRTINMISHRRDVNDYAFRENNYGSFSFPTVNLGFNVDDGLLVGLGVAITKRGFRAQPYSSMQRITTLFALQQQAFQIRYNGVFNDLVKHYDLNINLALLNPALQNFFGLGNETKLDTVLPLKYYRVRYSYLSGDVMVRKRAIHNKLSVAIGPSFFYYWNNNDRNSGRILSYPEQYGLDSTRIFSPKFYGGGKVMLDFNSIDNPLLPTRGLHFHVEGLAQTGLNEGTLPYYRLQSDMSLYAPLSDNKRFVLALRAGGGHIFSDSYEYWQALTLGANNYLRGYRKNRFSGSSMAYGSAELRWRVAQVKSHFLPGEFGLVGFQDIGRVWKEGESSDKWHLDYGGGLYFTPYNSVLISVLGAISEEERLTNISIGAGLNITF